MKTVWPIGFLLLFSCFAAQVYAQTEYLHPTGSVSVSLSSGANDSADTGNVTASFTDPNGKYEQNANASTASGLGAKTSFQRTPVGYGQNSSGTTWARADLKDRIVVAPDSCDFDYSNTGLTVTCFGNTEGLTLPVSPKLNYHANFTTEVQLDSGLPSDIYAGGLAVFYASYGTGSVTVTAQRCANDGNTTSEPPPPCTETGISSDGILFPTTGDESSSTGGWVVGDPMDLPILKVVGSASFDMELRLYVEAKSFGRGGSSGYAVADALNTLTFASTGPVFDLPAGYTAYSTSGAIRDNLNYGYSHVFTDGFEQ